MGACWGRRALARLIGELVLSCLSSPAAVFESGWHTDELRTKAFTCSYPTTSPADQPDNFLTPSLKQTSGASTPQVPMSWWGSASSDVAVLRVMQGQKWFITLQPKPARAPLSFILVIPSTCWHNNFAAWWAKHTGQCFWKDKKSNSRVVTSWKRPIPITGCFYLKITKFIVIPYFWKLMHQMGLVIGVE